VLEPGGVPGGWLSAQFRFGYLADKEGTEKVFRTLMAVRYAIPGDRRGSVYWHLVRVRVSRARIDE